MMVPHMQSKEDGGDSGVMLQVIQPAGGYGAVVPDSLFSIASRPHPHRQPCPKSLLLLCAASEMGCW